MNYLLQFYRLIFFAAVFLCSTVHAGQTGRITGTITDKRTGEAVVGASILIRGTKMGASSDYEGYYSIGNIPPGTYTVTVSSVGFKTITVNNVKVTIDLTTSLNLQMEETIIEMGEGVVIEAERPLVQKDLTSTSVTVSSDEMKLMPVENLSQVINLQAGVVDGHFRGGRSGEVAYLIDGIPVNNPLHGGSGLTPEKASVREMEVISGTFNAEYGQAMSGVVNIVTKDGSAEFHGSAGAYAGDFLTTNTNVFTHLDVKDFTRIKNYEFSLSGPTVLLRDLTFFITGRMQDDKGHLYGRRMYRQLDTVINNQLFNFILPGDSTYVSMNPFKKNSLSGKLSYSLGGIKISYSGFWEHAKWKGYDHAFKYVPDKINSHVAENWVQNFQINHVLSNSTDQYFRVSVSKYTQYGQLYDDPYDPRYIDPQLGSFPTDYTFRYGGNHSDRYRNLTQTTVGQWTFSSQITKEHKIGMGIETRFHKIFDHYMTLSRDTIVYYDSLGNEIPHVYIPTYLKLGIPGNQRFLKYPYEVSAYLQDKIEYDIMIINAGVRFDYFDPQTKVLYDLKNPRRNPVYPNAGRMRGIEPKYQISPRLGISFPITDNGIIHFSYGHFFQIPSFNTLYLNSDYAVDPNAQLTTTMGNPDIDAQRTVTYELGLQQAFMSNLSVDFSVYYRDIRNLLGSEILESYEGIKYARYINRDYGNVRGFILSLEKRYSDYYSVRADYTFQVAEGNASDPLSVFYNNQASPPIETNKKVVPLNWDQRSTFNLSLNVGEQSNWMTGVIFNYGSGLPYTPDVVTAGTIRYENSRLRPSTYNVDFRAEKNFRIAAINLNVFLLVYNLLDIKNEVWVDARSGRANIHYFTASEGYGPGPIAGINTYEEYMNNPTAISTPRNYRVGVNIDF